MTAAARRADVRSRSPPYAPVVTNRFRHQVLRIEEQSISLDRLNANFAEYHHETLSFALPDSK